MQLNNKVIFFALIAHLLFTFGTPALNVFAKGSGNFNSATFQSLIPHEDLGVSLNCIGTYHMSNAVAREKEFIINTQSEYNNLNNYILPSRSCKNYNLPESDLSENTILGKFASGSGCKLDFERNVYRQDKSKDIIYQINVIEYGTCKKAVSSMNWIIVPKISSDYNIIIRIQNTKE